MRLDHYNGSAALALLAAGLLGSGSALANTCPPGSVQQNDACGGIDPDPNGGCNFAPVLLQFAGTPTLATPLTICGTVGTFDAASRDLDWYEFNLAVPSVITVTASKSPTLFTIFLRDGIVCTDPFVFAQVATTTGQIALPAGNHTLAVTVNAFAPDEPACPGQYAVSITVNSEINAACGGSESCIEPHATGGCDNLACCDQVCQFDPSCCDSAWTSDCVDLAVALCGLFIYDCVSPGGAPSNDCATNPAPIACGAEAVAFNTTNAGTDGPPGTGCTNGKDIWYLVQFGEQGGGELEVAINTPGWDSTLSLYGLGATPVFDPSNLPNLLIGCLDGPDGMSGGEALVLIDAVEGDYYLIQVAGFDDGSGADFGTGNINIACRRLVFDTGNTRAVQFDATNMGNFGALVNLGLSSGFLNAANPQRWYATPITIDSPGPGLDWEINSINVYGFSPAGVLNETMDWKIWCRTDLCVPPTDSPADYEGSVPFPVPYDIVGGAATENHEIPINLPIPAGDYWFTAYAANGTGGVTPANFAWFINPPDGIDINCGNGPQGWRSAMFPTPGFVIYQPPPTTLQQAPGLDPADLFGVGLRILGTKIPGGAPNPCSVLPPCPWDLSGDGVVDGADLGILLGGWGEFDGADLGQLLGSWGPCPQ